MYDRVPNPYPNFCAWILSGFCSVPVDKREAKTRKGATYF